MTWIAVEVTRVRREMESEAVTLCLGLIGTGMLRFANRSLDHVNGC
jgi:hypothetical protein